MPLRKINKNPVYPAHKIFRIRVLPARMKQVYEPHHRGRQRQREAPTWNIEHRFSVSFPNLLDPDLLGIKGGIFRASILIESIIRLLPKD